MIKFIQNNNCFRLEGWGVYPILGDTEQYVWGKSWDSEDESVKEYPLQMNRTGFLFLDTHII